MTPAATIRTAHDGDLPAMRRLAAACFVNERVQRAGIVDLLHRRPDVDPGLRLVAERDGDVVGLLFASTGSVPVGDTGYVDGWAVAPAERRHGIGSALLSEAEARLSGLGCRSMKFGGTTWYYAWPGIDLGYTAALVAAQKAGFSRDCLVHNMDVDLRGWVGAAPSAAVGIRRARASDGPALRELIAAHFDDVWQHEVGRVLRRSPPTLHLAEDGGRVVGFAAHGVYLPDLFGPLGTDPAHRGRGIGVALLEACLSDMAAAGLPVAQIGWIGPAAFYAAAVDARIGRTFAVLGKQID